MRRAERTGHNFKADGFNKKGKGKMTTCGRSNRPRRLRDSTGYNKHIRARDIGGRENLRKKK
jgi:hypothetical protein